VPDWLQALILGAVQGLTEFLPVSSSGHLVLLQTWLGEDFFAAGDEVLFDLVLHFGTLLPVLFFYRADLLGMAKNDEGRRLGLMVLVATVPTGLIGLGLEDRFDALFSSVGPVCIGLLVTAALLIGTRFIPASDDDGKLLTWQTALIIGVVQGLAITPGISRSGSTIAVALVLGLSREHAARFSFLASVPAILGAVILKGRHGFNTDSVEWVNVGIGFLTAMVVGYGALILLVALVKKGGLHRFAWYLVPAALGAWWLLSG
jgi:undecaprenyl-diphosphatase